MSKHTVEFELLAPGRDETGGRQRQYGWPPTVANPAECEFGYRAFRDAYNRFERERKIAEDIYQRNPTLSDAELRVRWLSYHSDHKRYSQPQLQAFAREVSRSHEGLLPATTHLERGVIFAVMAVLLIVLML